MELIDARFVDVSAFLIVTPGPTWRLSPAMPWAGRLPRPEDLSHALDICSRGTTVSTPIVSSGAVYR